MAASTVSQLLTLHFLSSFYLIINPAAQELTGQGDKTGTTKCVPKRVDRHDLTQGYPHLINGGTPSQLAARILPATLPW